MELTWAVPVTFDELYESFHGRVFGYAARRVGFDEAADVVSETFAAAWKHLQGMPEEPLPWLLAIARHKVFNSMRAQNRRDALTTKLVQTASPTSRELELHDRDISSIVVRGLACLTATDREAITLIAWDELTPKEAAEVLGIGALAFRVRLHRAKNRLRSILCQALLTDTGVTLDAAELVPRVKEEQSVI